MAYSKRLALLLELALPEEKRGLAAAALINQTLTWLVSELIYIRVIPAVVWQKNRLAMHEREPSCVPATRQSVSSAASAGA
jgi:hypothetical protein